MRSDTVILQVWTTLQGLHVLLTTYADLSHVMRDVVDNMKTSGQYEIAAYMYFTIITFFHIL
jgi:hypothetical protein